MGAAASHRRRCHRDADAYLKVWLHGSIQKRRHYLLGFILGTVSMHLSGYNNSVPEMNVLPLSNRYGALEYEGLATEDVGEGEAPSRGLPRMSQTAPRITTASTKKKRRVIVIGDSLLRGTEGPIC